MSAIDLDAAIAVLVVTVSNYDTTKGNLTLNMRDMNNVPPELALVDYPCLFPNPDGNFWKENDTEPGVFDNITGREYSQYSLNYLLALAPLGSVRGPWELYTNSIRLTIALKEKIRGIDLKTLTKVSGVAVSGVRVLEDAGGHKFHGCTVAVSAQEYIGELE
jgi:hypothetical protein